jgi:hypothetical protein
MSIDWRAACERQVIAHLQSHVRDIVLAQSENRMTQASGRMKDKRGVILGVANNRSIALVDA